ncbi:autotransporter-associated beta strand repeat-containing protein, partial [Polynucleobacter sp. es-MAR-4]|uniref:beta strand repeat-containing protein n=1 Tax=Polynucleobacter sp. es-MAR-4 TaxID=1855655 RepID=UPI001C0C0401
ADVLFNSWVSGTYSKVISGTGNVTISGADVTYTGDNTYTGATINYGTLRIGANGTTGSVVADGGITNTGNVYFNRSDNPTYAGVISGSGNVRLMNSTTFTGNSTYTGETILAANATLTLGANGTSGSVANSSLISFADGATLRLNRSDDLTIASSIYRAGGTNYLIKDGAGNVTLTSTSGQNTFAGTVTVNAGSLIVQGALGASSAVAVQNNNATVIYNSSSNQSLATLNGTGSFQKLGTGALLLTTSSGFTGNTTVTGGTLDLRNTVIGGNITNNADVLFNSWVSGTYSKVISGTGNVTISGADVTYTGDNTYTGATTIYGILRVGANGTIGNLASSNISGSGTLTFNRSNAVEYAGNISGTVEVKKYGNGTLSLTGTNTQTTAVNVYAGALQIGNGSTAGSLTSNIILSSGAAAIFNRSDDLQYGGNISGTGAMLTQLGSGTLTLTGLSTYTGATNVSAGSIIFTNNARPSTSGFTGTGNVTITPAGSAFTSAFSTGSYTYANTLGSLTIGNASSSANANITVNAALGIAGNINLYGGNIAVNSALTTAGSSIIRLAAAPNGNITQGASGNITTSGLALLGGNANLTNVNNSVSTLAAQDVANMSFVNAGNLIIGAVNPTGVDVTGTINITAQSGNISLTEALATTSNASNAIVLNAGAGTAAGTATGGNILISGNGSVSVGSGGRATLFTGSIANSTGLTNLVGSGSGNFRYNSNASSTGYNSTAAALGAGTYAVYRE